MKKVFDNKKVLLGLITVILIFAIIFVSSFWPFILDPSRIMTAEFLTDELIITAIVLSVTISMLFVAQASNANNKDSELAKAKVEFVNSLKRIAVHSHLYQWIKKVLQPNDRKEIAEREMAKLMIPYQVYELSDTEILTLVQPQKIEDKFYGPYDIKKLKKVIKLKSDVAKVKFVAPNYYTSVKSIQSDKTLSELAKNENAKKVLTIVLHLSVRVLITWISASILGSLVRDLTQDTDVAQAWLKFLSRAFAFASSCFLGYNVGCKLNDLDAFYILKRVETHTLYLEDTTFKPVDEAKEAFKERVLNEEHKLLEQSAHLIEHQEGSN